MIYCTDILKYSHAVLAASRSTVLLLLPLSFILYTYRSYTRSVYVPFVLYAHHKTHRVGGNGAAEACAM